MSSTWKILMLFIVLLSTTVLVSCKKDKEPEPQIQKEVAGCDLFNTQILHGTWYALGASKCNHQDVCASIQYDSIVLILGSTQVSQESFINKVQQPDASGTKLIDGYTCNKILYTGIDTDTYYTLLEDGRLRIVEIYKNDPTIDRVVIVLSRIS